MISQNIYETDAEFEVICTRCKRQFMVLRNWGGGLRRDGKGCGRGGHPKPAQCDCGSHVFEVF